MNIFYFMIGSILGSFLVVCAKRIPIQEHFLISRSHCDHCQRNLSFWEMIPIVSSIVLKFRCRTCHQPIPVSYCLFEILYGCLFVFCLQQSGVKEISLSLIWLTMAVLLSLTDLFYWTVEPKLFYPFAGGLWLINFSFGFHFYWQSLLLICFIIILFSIYLHGKMGMGDLLLLLAWAPWLTPNELAWLLLLASFSALMVFLIYRLIKKECTKLPFVPFLSMALFFVHFF